MAIAIVLIVAAVAVIYAVQWLVDTSFNTADRAVRHKTYEQGRAEAATGLEISTPTTPNATLDEIVGVVNAYSSAPALVMGLYVKDRTADTATFAVGSKGGGDAFVAEVALEPTASGSAGSFDVLAWRESGAEVHGRKDMKRLRDRITQAVEALGGAVEPV